MSTTMSVTSARESRRRKISEFYSRRKKVEEPVEETREKPSAVEGQPVYEQQDGSEKGTSPATSVGGEEHEEGIENGDEGHQSLRKEGDPCWNMCGIFD